MEPGVASSHWNGKVSGSVALGVGVSRSTHLLLRSDGGPSCAIPATRAAVPTSSIRAGSFHVPGALGWSRSGRVSRPLAIAVGGRRVDLLLPDCRCPPACSLRETMFCSPAFGPFGGAGYLSFSRAALPHGAGVS